MLRYVEVVVYHIMAGIMLRCFKYVHSIVAFYIRLNHWMMGDCSTSLLFSLSSTFFSHCTASLHWSRLEPLWSITPFCLQ